MKSGNERSIQSLDRAFDILQVIGQSDAKGLSLKEICGVTKLHPSTTHHLLSTMVARGYVSQNSDSRRYMLGPTLLQMRSAALDRLDLQSIRHVLAKPRVWDFLANSYALQYEAREGLGMLSI